MTPLKSFLDPPLPLCIDASTAINLNATGVAERVLSALPVQVVISEAAFAELKVCRRSGRDDAAISAALVSNGSLVRVKLPDAAEEAFLRLTVGSAADTVDDGEAATIAHAVAAGAIAVIDERKATLLSQRLYPSLRMATTVDLLAHPAVANQLGSAPLGDAVYHALRQARMRVPRHHVEWVEIVVGAARFAECESIPLDVRNALLEKAREGG